MFRSRTIGHSEIGLPISILEMKPFAPILIVSAIHGDEVEGVLLNSMLMSELRASPLAEKITFLPILNPDGFNLHQRWNVNQVDLNRNWPAKDWSPIATNPRYPPGPKAASESETNTLLNLIRSEKFQLIIELHSYKDSVLLPSFLANGTAPLEAALTDLQSDLNIPVVREAGGLGYELKGGLYTWCLENGIHNLGLEIEKGLGAPAIKERYLAPMIQFLTEIVPTFPARL